MENSYGNVLSHNIMREVIYCELTNSVFALITRLKGRYQKTYSSSQYLRPRGVNLEVKNEPRDALHHFG